METWRPTLLRVHPAMGRGGGGGGRGGFGGHGERFGVMVKRAPFENGFCGPNEEVGADGMCHPIMMMGQAAPSTPAPVTSTGEPWSTWLGRTAAIAGVAGAVTQLVTKEGSGLHMIGGYAEIFAIASLAGLVAFGKVV